MSDEVITEPMAIRVGDRVALENRIDVHERGMRTFIEATHEARNVFYQTRMVPLEKMVADARGFAVVAMTLSIVSLCVSILALLLILILHVAV